MPIRQSAQGTLAAGITVALGSITVDTQNFGGTATWNNSGVTFTGIKLNITDTASNAASLLMDLQVAGTSKFKVDKGGAVTTTGDFTVSGNVVTNGGFLRAAAGSKLGGGTDGAWGFSNNAGTRGITWDFTAADGSVKLTNRAGTGEGLLFAGSVNYLGTATGLVNVMAVAPSPAVIALTTGCLYLIQANITNTTTAPTLNINGLGAKTIVKRAATALAAGDYVANMMCLFIYDGTNMELLNPVVN